MSETTSEAEPRIAPHLTDALSELGREYGPLGVALAAAHMTNVDVLVRQLTRPNVEPVVEAEPVDRETRYHVVNGWLCEDVNEHTCGSTSPHEPGCGLVPIALVDDLLRDAHAYQSIVASVRAGVVMTLKRAEVSSPTDKAPTGGLDTWEF